MFGYFLVLRCACGGGIVTPLNVLEGCPLAWPAGRSLEQQEALLEHSQLVRDRLPILDGRQPIPSETSPHWAVYDRDAVTLFVVQDGPALETALRALRVHGRADPWTETAE